MSDRPNDRIAVPSFKNTDPIVSMLSITGVSQGTNESQQAVISEAKGK